MKIEYIVIGVVGFVIFHFLCRALWMMFVTHPEVDSFRGWVHESGEFPGRASKWSWSNIFKSEVRASGQSASGSVPYFLNGWNWSLPCSVAIMFMVIGACVILYLLIR